MNLERTVTLPSLRMPLDAAALRLWRDVALDGDNADTLSAAELQELTTKANDMYAKALGGRQ